MHHQGQGKEVEKVDFYKYLGVHINSKLDWTHNTDALYRKGQTLTFLLFFAVVCWGGGIEAGEANKLNKLVKKASSVVGLELDSLEVVGFRVLGPSDPLSVQLGGSVMLPCYVETPLPMDELEVEWKRTDTLVHLWQNGQSEPESQNQDYRERAHFFSEEVKHGNFSLLLTNVTSKDAGVYRCVVNAEKESNEASIEIKEPDHLIVTGGHAVSAHAGEDVTLNCSIKSHLPLEQIEQIEWRKVNESILVLLYVNGEVLTDSSDERYRDRVELFSNEEVQKGNFSLRLKNVRTEDKGMFMCVAFHGDLSANATVEVQQLEIEMPPKTSKQPKDSQLLALAVDISACDVANQEASDEEIPQMWETISNRILQTINKRFDKFEQSFQHLQTTLQSVTERMEAAEGHVNNHSQP
ncbi:programmed cell death 1 ligand 1-like [Trichomycterus rosablanca]|uniref:programmed cell death 1 ligand 1-like n=1 Tax=Trichomycterus rosablanca TaxID=2290929 RepID=UPI002F359FD8